MKAIAVRLILSSLLLPQVCLGPEANAQWDISVDLVPVRGHVGQYEPMYIGVRIRNAGKSEFHIVIDPYRDTWIERRVGSSWVSTRDEKSSYVGSTRSGHSFLTVPAGGSIWMQYRIIDQRVIAKPASYRMRVRWRPLEDRPAARTLWSGWVSAEVGSDPLCAAVLSPGSKLHAQYWAAIQRESGVAMVTDKGAYPADIAHLRFDRCMEALSSVDLSPGLRERFILYEAQALVERARQAKDKERGELLEQAAALLNRCNARKYTGPTGGLGRGILMTRARCHELAGRKAEFRMACEEIVLRYEGGAEWAKQQIRKLDLREKQR